MDGDAYDRLQHELAVLARRGERIRLAAAERAGSDLDRSGFLLLARLREAGPQTMGDLAAAWGLDASTVTRQVQPLEDSGLVQRRRGETDRRTSVVAITERGATELEAVRAARGAFMRERLAPWAEDDVAQLADLLLRFNDGFHAGDAQRTPEGAAGADPAAATGA